jgi:hypothetical protein
MRVQVRVHRDVVRLRFKHCLVCRAVELCLCENCVNSCKFWNAGGLKSGQSQRVLFCDDRGRGPEVGGEKGGVVSFGDEERSISAKSEETAFVSVRAEDHEYLWANRPGLRGDCNTVDVRLEVSRVETAVDNYILSLRCGCL